MLLVKINSLNKPILSLLKIFEDKIKTQQINNDFINGIWAAKKNKILAIMKRIKRQSGRYYIY